MASRLGQFTPGAGSGGTLVASVSTGARSTTTGSLIWGYVKWEAGGGGALGLAASNKITDTAGNTYTVVGETAAAGGGSAPGGAFFYCLNATGNAANVVTANFAATEAVYEGIFAEEWSGLDSVDSSVYQGSGSGTSYSVSSPGASITTTGPGLVAFGVSGFMALSGITGGGTPTFTIGGSTADAFVGYLASGSAQAVTPAASAVESNLWLMKAIAFRDAAGGKIPKLMLQQRMRRA